MAKFGRFEFGESEPCETYEGERMQVEKGYVKILRDGAGLTDLQTEQPIAVVRLDRGQCMWRLKRSRY